MTLLLALSEPMSVVPDCILAGMTNGFGFSFPNDSNDDGEGDGNNRGGDGNGRGNDNGRGDANNPFAAFGFGGGQPGGGGLGDVFNQLGQMLSGMGSSMNAQASGDAVNFELAARMARQRIAGASPVSEADTRAAEESLRLVELWLDEATDLPASGAKAQAWNAEQWLNQTMPMWKRLVNPVAEHMNRAQLDSMPEQAREMMGPMAGMMNQMNSMQFGMKLGHALGDLAQQALTGSDFGLPVAPAGTAAILPRNVTEISKAATRSKSRKRCRTFRARTSPRAWAPATPAPPPAWRR